MRIRLFSLGLAATGLAVAVRAQSPAASHVVTAGHVFQQTKRLVRQDAEPVSRQRLAPAAPGFPVETPEPDNLGENVVRLDPMVVRTFRAPVLPPVAPETPVAEFFRTGTFWERIGRRITTKIWARGDKGLMFGISW